MVTIVYWSGTGNTEAMAKEIEEAVKSAGAEVETLLFEDTSVDAVAGKDVVLLGCPAMGAEELEETIVEPFFVELEGKLSGKKIGLFGSYGWGTGEWMDNWKQRAENAGATVIGTAIVNETPDNAEECVALGKAAAQA
ncbi:flavodoxin [Megasphaera vaginalis (ex Srinivasan et al. 2021)]|uniref:Flavodoxin n=1 Tax=Megasphaera vaginalis (ex Srinivasan et al. 2021) TaxID=1111454 RepID=U7UNK6_9FIRM|nr:flavodoxin [Megasphaera vaginalis (ex Srinivasan et al. 2021)]ERT61027.1 flavodoxin [Megasphaera vaginalis (ex Srinivasan et al. 2021)]